MGSIFINPYSQPGMFAHALPMLLPGARYLASTQDVRHIPTFAPVRLGRIYRMVTVQSDRPPPHRIG